MARWRLIGNDDTAGVADLLNGDCGKPVVWIAPQHLVFSGPVASINRKFFSSERPTRHDRNAIGIKVHVSSLDASVDLDRTGYRRAGQSAIREGGNI